MAHSAIPPYFSWVVDRLLAVSAHPYHHAHLRYLTENGINLVISLNDSRTEPPFHTRPQLRVVYLNTPSGGAPSIYEVDRFVDIMEDAKRRNEVIIQKNIFGIHLG